MSLGALDFGLIVDGAVVMVENAVRGCAEAQRASARLMIVLPLALFLIFVLLFTTFRSVRQALLIYTGIPFAVVGGILALALRGMPFSISAGVGFIALFG